MIRDRLKRAARRVAIKLLNMEFDTEDRDPNARGVADPSKFDPDKIPKVVDGAGDTPGPNHKENIGRTWVSAQVAANAAPLLLDVRPPAEVVAGMLPGAQLASGSSIQRLQELLPEDRSERVVVYDQTGDQDAAAVAAWLREQGWSMARRLQGGYAEWLEHDEPTATPARAPDARYQIGQRVQLSGGRKAFIHTHTAPGSYLVWLPSDALEGPLTDDDLDG